MRGPLDAHGGRRQARARRGLLPARLAARKIRPRGARWALGALFAVLIALFAAGLWGTILRPTAYEVRGEFVARARPDLIVVRHEAISGLGMRAMEMMAVDVRPEQVDPLDLRPGDRLQLAVRPAGDDVTLVWIRRDR